MSSGPATNPFPGLRPFETNEGYLFFGREGEREELLRRLLQVRLLSVVGTSGSGKSSLVRAGLVPYLLALPDPHWKVATFRPSGNPIGSLAGALNNPDVIGKAAESGEDAARDRSLLEARLRRGGLGLIEVVRLARLTEGQNILIVIDQFEEVFRFVESSDYRDDGAAFVKLILEAARQTELPIYIVLTMRSDFIGDCSQFHELPETVAVGLYLIPRMTRDQLRAAIEKPVRIAGGSISRRLTNRVLNDAGDDPDQLPIMQHALMRTWQNWKEAGSLDGRPMDLENYLAIGGMAEALSKHADEAFNELGDKGKDIARRMFQCLTEKGADNRPIRRATDVDALAKVVGVTGPELTDVIETFRKAGRSFLMPSSAIPLNAETRVDISHESLIRRWNRLSDWVEEEAESAAIYRRLDETAVLHKQRKAGLWGDPDLADSLAWKDRTQPTAAWAQRYGGHFKTATDFLQESRIARDAALLRKRRLWQSLVAATASVIIGLSIVTAWALRERDHALSAEQSARDAAVDVTQVANLSRQQLSEALQSYESSIEDTLNWGPAAWSDYLHQKKARALENSDNFSGARDAIDLVRKANPDYLTALNTSSDLYIVAGNADDAARDADAYLQIIKTNAVAYGNSVLAEGMRRNYSKAVSRIDEALQNALLPISDLESLVAPDLQDLTHGFKLSVPNSDFLLALRYTKAFLYAMSGDARFQEALDEADKSDRDYPNSRNAYLAALNWQWLIIRGQGLHDAQAAAPDGASAPPSELADYGAYAIAGALWDRVSRTRAEYRERGASSYEKFQAAYRSNPQNRYEPLVDWVHRQQRKPVEAAPPESLVIDRARTLAQQADELKAPAGSHPINFFPAFAQLSEAIDLLKPKPDSNLGRRQHDLLIDLLLRRAGWRLEGSADERDRGGASEDARAVIALDQNVSEAYRLLAAAAFDDNSRKTNDEQALKIDPYNSAALQDLANLIEKDDTKVKDTIALVQRRRRVTIFSAHDYLQLAQLNVRLGDYADALHNIDRAIEEAPWRLDLYNERRAIEQKIGNLDQATIDLHFAQGLHGSASYETRTGDDGLALKRYLIAFMTASSLETRNGEAKFELDTIVRNLSTFLSTNYGLENTRMFWRTLSQDPVLNLSQQQLAAQEASRLSN
jgi:hypothetical protein